MPINFNLEQLRNTFGCVNYFETGLWDPNTDVSSKYALSCGFEKVYCIEIREDWVEMGKKVFKSEIENGRYHLFLDDSTNMKKYMDDTLFKDRTMFFLDAHVDNINIHNYKKRCPLFDELEAIKSLSRNDNIILVDDLRIINTPYPWGEFGYGNIDFLQSIQDMILSINPNYKFSTLNGHIENDVLIAFL